MARPREFDREQALQRAIGVFRQKGYAASSTDELMQAMGISRQSMYDTFGDKRQLYMEALSRYASDRVSEQIRRLDGADSPVSAIEELLLEFAVPEANVGCMGVNAICEFGQSDAEIKAVTDSDANRLNAVLKRALRRAKVKREIDKSVDIAAAADFLAAILTGIKVSAKAGKDPASLKQIVRFAMRTLLPSRHLS
jgi:TetR/AcrR family transcriptional regulator, transcriptional repressor for nem operon